MLAARTQVYLTEDQRREIEKQRAALDETFGVAPDFPYPDRDEPDRFDKNWNRMERESKPSRGSVE
ncbi:MAG TPA: hypothetical protein VIJ33_10390 [Solirubrobacteraceae bacterium]